MAPRGQVEIKASCREFAAVAVVAGGTRQVLEPPRGAGQVRTRKTHIARALVPGIVAGDQPPLAFRLPGPGDEGIPRPVAVPAGHAFEEAPLAVANGGLPHAREEAGVEQSA